MRILGIETSCDETAAAVVVDGHPVPVLELAEVLERRTGLVSMIRWPRRWPMHCAGGWRVDKR
jgi:hypothetical protein